MKILNLHGYAANSQNSSCRALRSCGLSVVSPQLDYDHLLPDDIFSSILHLYDAEQCQAVVGSSLGGFFAIQVAALKKCPAVLINPCLAPFQTLPELGFHNRTFLLRYIAMFSKLAELDFSRTFAIIGMNDTLIQTHPIMQYLLDKQNCILVPEGGHAGSSLPLEELFRTYHKKFFC